MAKSFVSPGVNTVHFVVLVPARVETARDLAESFCQSAVVANLWVDFEDGRHSVFAVADATAVTDDVD